MLGTYSISNSIKSHVRLLKKRREEYLSLIKLKLIICYSPRLIFLHFICNVLFFIILMKSVWLNHVIKSDNTLKNRKNTFNLVLNYVLGTTLSRNYNLLQTCNHFYNLVRKLISSLSNCTDDNKVGAKVCHTVICPYLCQLSN